MRNILVAVTGLTPQVVTETLYYYTKVAHPQVSFDEVRLITTLEGKKRVMESLLNPSTGVFRQFCRDYSVNDFVIDETCIEVIGGARPLSDIRTIEDNGRMAAHIMDIIRHLTEHPDTALYCSIAGGRKTMGAYLALALQLYGRTQDRLSHVLISPQFESLPDFFYPTPKDHIIQGRDASGRTITLNAKNARIELADIPFVSVRRILPTRGDFPVEELVRRLQASVEGPKDPTRLKISLQRKIVWVNDVAMKLPPRELALYLFFADAKRKCRKKGCKSCTDCFHDMNTLTTQETVQRILARHRVIAGRHSGHLERTEMMWKKGLPDENYFLGVISKINKALRRNVDERDYPMVEISHVGTYGNKRYGIALDRRHIEC